MQSVCWFKHTQTMQVKRLALMMWRNGHKLQLLFCLLIIFGLQQELIHRSSHLCFSSCLSRFMWTFVNCSQSKFRDCLNMWSRPPKHRNSLKHFQSVSLWCKEIHPEPSAQNETAWNVCFSTVSRNHTETLLWKSNTSPQFLCRSVSYKGLPYFEYLSVRWLWHDRNGLWATKKYILSKPLFI